MSSHVELPYDYERVMRQRQRDWDRSERLRRSRETKRQDYESMQLAKEAMKDAKEKVSQSVDLEARISPLSPGARAKYCHHHERIREDYNAAIREFRQTVKVFLSHSVAAIREKKAEIREWTAEYEERRVELREGNQRWEVKEEDAEKLQNHKDTMGKQYRRNARSAMAEMEEAIQGKEADLAEMTDDYNQVSEDLENLALEHRLLSIEWTHPLSDSM
ncbi:unnamed protein product [Discula destructiva]